MFVCSSYELRLFVVPFAPAATALGRKQAHLSAHAWRALELGPLALILMRRQLTCASLPTEIFGQRTIKASRAILHEMTVIGGYASHLLVMT